MLEKRFQAGVIREIQDRIPDCIVLKNDPNYLQGIPDIQISKGQQVAWLECKKSEKEVHQPNQDFYVNQINNQGGFARFIYPENRGEVLNELYKKFGV